MYTIAICDDDMPAGVQLEEQLEEYCRERGIKSTVKVCMSGNELKKELKDRHYDLIFLDIELVSESGVEVGQYIREGLDEHVTEIVYVSAHTQYAMELFQVQPMDFLKKPLDKQEVFRVMERFEKRAGTGRACFRYRSGGQIYSVAFREIVYFESVGKKVKIYLANNTIKEFYGKLSDVVNQVENYGFLLIHKSFCVNYAYVKLYENDRMVVESAGILNISKTHRSAVHKRIMELEMKG